MCERDSIILSGNSGFLGTILSRKLDALGFDILGLSSCIGSKRQDISIPFNISEQSRADIVIHAAGKAHSIPKSEKARREFYDVNFTGTINLCEALERLSHMPKSFIFISTVAVYGVDDGSYINEGHPLNGDTPYAESKIMAERWLEDWADEHNIILGILRLPLVVGPNPPSNLKAMINGIRNGRYLSIGSGNARKSMVWAEDIATIIPTLAKKGGTYHLTDGDHPSFGELEAAISEAIGKRNPSKVPYWMARGLALTGDLIGPKFPINSNKLKKITSTLTFDDTKAKKQLGWNPNPVLNKIRELVGNP